MSYRKFGNFCINTLFFVFIFTLLWFGYVIAKVDHRCKVAGWKNGHVTLHLEQFCSKRANGTDILYHIDAT